MPVESLEIIHLRNQARLVLCFPRAVTVLRANFVEKEKRQPAPQPFVTFGLGDAGFLDEIIQEYPRLSSGCEGAWRNLNGNTQNLSQRIIFEQLFR